MNERTVTVTGKISYDQQGNKLGVVVKYRIVNGVLTIEHVESLSQTTSLSDLQTAISILEGELSNGN